MNVILVGATCGITKRVPEPRLSAARVRGRRRAESMAAKPVSSTDASFPACAARTELTALVEFWADWCVPCEMMAPHGANAASQLPTLRFGVLATEANPSVDAARIVRDIPTGDLYRAGRETGRQSGALISLNLLRSAHARLAGGGSVP
jgi:thioredoxin 2